MGTYISAWGTFLFTFYFGLSNSEQCTSVVAPFISKFTIISVYVSDLWMQQIVCKSLKDSPFEILKIAHVSSLDAQFLYLFLVNVPCLEERERVAISIYSFAEKWVRISRITLTRHSGRVSAAENIERTFPVSSRRCCRGCVLVGGGLCA